MDYAIVIATRNRLDALRASLPLFLGQTLPPRRVVIVDASDDHAEVRDFCLSFRSQAFGPIEVLRSELSNSAYQRNLGVDLVEEPIVAFPDDDSLWPCDTGQRLMEAYCDDVEERVGGIGGMEIYRTPLAHGTHAPPKKTEISRLPLIAMTRNCLEDWLIPQPFNLYARERMGQLAPAARAAGFPHLLVETLGGFRMSFRTKLVRRYRFDETLGCRLGYAIGEDKEFGLRLLREGHLLAVAQRARVFHNTHPGRRANGFAYGFFHLFNYMYICRKLFDETSAGLTALRPYIRYKRVLYELRRGNAYYLEIARGARAASSEFECLMATPRHNLPEYYLEATAEHFSVYSHDPRSSAPSR